MRRGTQALGVEGSLTPGNKVRLLRDALGLTQEEMGEAFGVNRGTIASYETRPNASPSAANVRKVSERYGVPLGWFYDGENTPPPNVAHPSQRPGAITASDALPSRYAHSSIERLSMFAEAVGSMAAHRAQPLLGQTEGEVIVTVSIEVRP